MATMTRQLAAAKHMLSEIFSRALSEGPQFVIRSNEEVVILARNEYDRLSNKREKPHFIEFLMSGPGFDGVDVERDRSPMRDVGL